MSSITKCPIVSLLLSQGWLKPLVTPRYSCEEGTKDENITVASMPRNYYTIIKENTGL